MQRGINRPFLIEARERESGESQRIVVKPKAGYGSERQIDILRECLTLALAQNLGIHVPEPVFVCLPKNFGWFAQDFDDLAEIIKQSIGWNLGTVFLGENWKTWNPPHAPASIPQNQMQDVYAYDGITQNSDRTRDNPNLLWKGSELVALDFDRAFQALPGQRQHKKWKWEALNTANLRQHCLRPHLQKPEDGRLLAESLWDEWEEWWLDPSLECLTQTIVAGLTVPDARPSHDLTDVVEYLHSVTNEIEDYFRILTHVAFQ